MTSPADNDVKSDVEPDVEPGAESDVDSGAGTPDPPPSRPRLPAIVLTVAVALLVASAAVAGWFGVAWMRAANDDSLRYSSAREEVERVARASIETMNTLDYRKLDEGLANWADVTTGDLHDEVLRLTEENKQQLRDAKSVTEAEVRSSAVRELDERTGRATVIAAVHATVSTGGGEATEKFHRIEAGLTRTDTGWKLSRIGEVPYAQPGQ